jgi:adenylate cyclase
MDTEAWAQAGLYLPDAPEADERLALLEFLTARGATVDQMVEAHRLGGLPALAGDLVFEAERRSVPLGELAAEAGVAVERMQRVLLAAGLPAQDGTELPEDLAEVMAAFEQGALIMGEDAILAFTRVLGAAATNIAEAAVALFYAELGPGTGREGSDELARARVSETAMLSFATVPGVLTNVLMAQFERASRRALVARGWTAPTADGLGADPGPNEIVALGFVDLFGSTEWAERLTLRDQSLALSRFESAAWSSAVMANGRVVKMIGDEVFFAAPTVDAACRIGIEVCQAAEADPLLPPARGAVGYGPVTPREGDYFGPLVNLTSRLVKAASPGTLVATQEAAAALSPGQWAVEERAPQQLRGLEHPVPFFSVRPAAPHPA